MKTIVLGYDDSEPSRRALDRAVQIAKAFGATILVTSVAPVVATGPRGGGTVPWDSPDVHAEELLHARGVLDGAGVASELIVGIGNPADVIADLADERGADLIVVGTSEPGMLDRLLSGSVSGTVARKAHRDVWIVH